jgi:hypothetical protein
MGMDLHLSFESTSEIYLTRKNKWVGSLYCHHKGKFLPFLHIWWHVFQKQKTLKLFLNIVCLSSEEYSTPLSIHLLFRQMLKRYIMLRIRWGRLPPALMVNVDTRVSLTVYDKEYWIPSVIIIKGQKERRLLLEEVFHSLFQL